jgi:queuine/archaeosine tRNA-ribosyltransferase
VRPSGAKPERLAATAAGRFYLERQNMKIRIADRISETQVALAANREALEQNQAAFARRIVDGGSTDTLRSKRAELEANIDALTAALGELERRLPAEEKVELAIELERALKYEAERTLVVQAREADLVAAEKAVDEAQKALDAARADRGEYEAFRAGHRYRQHRERYPHLYESEAA